MAEDPPGSSDAHQPWGMVTTRGRVVSSTEVGMIAVERHLDQLFVKCIRIGLFEPESTGETAKELRVGECFTHRLDGRQIRREVAAPPRREQIGILGLGRRPKNVVCELGGVGFEVV